MNVSFLVTIPVFTWSPTFSSDIATDFPLCRLTVAADGKQAPSSSPPGGAGGGAGGGAAGDGQQRRSTVWHSSRRHLGQHCSVNTSRPVIKGQHLGPVPHEYVVNDLDYEEKLIKDYLSLFECCTANYRNVSRIF